MHRTCAAHGLRIALREQAGAPGKPEVSYCAVLGIMLIRFRVKPPSTTRSAPFT